MAKGIYKRRNTYWIRYASHDGKIMFEKNKIWIVILFILILPSINACSVVMFSTMGTNYDKKMNRGDTSRDELHKLFGQPISAETYSTLLYPEDLPALKPCLRNDDPTQQHREIIGFEVFKIKGVVRTNHASNAVYVLVTDIFTLGIFEIVAFPYATYEWIEGTVTEKNVTVWYGIDNTFAVGEIRYSTTNEFITFMPKKCLGLGYFAGLIRNDTSEIPTSRNSTLK